MKSNQPKVSVVMTVFNSEKYLADAIESILSQTFKDFELIILDDGSTDKSLSIIKKYALTDRRIRILSRKNKGISESANEAIALARGEYIARMDSDDISMPDRLARQLAYLQDNKKCICVSGAIHVIDEKARFLTTLFLPERNEDIQALLLEGHCSIANPAVMFSMKYFNLVGGYDPTFKVAEDFDLWLKLGERGELGNLKEPMLKYRLHGKSISELNAELTCGNIMIASENAFKRRGISGIAKKNDYFRPTKEKESKIKFFMQYGWWAFNSKQDRTALIYGLKVISIAPLKKEGWIMILVILKRQVITKWFFHEI